MKEVESFLRPKVFQLRIERLARILCMSSEVAAAVLPASLPPLLPSRAVKLVFPQLAIHFVVRPAHPPPEPFSSLCPRSVLWPGYPLLKVAGAGPARIQLAEQRQEVAHVCLLLRICPFRVRGGDGVEQSPAVIPQPLNVRRTVGGEDWKIRMGSRRRGHLVSALHLGAEHGSPVGGRRAGPASEDPVLERCITRRTLGRARWNTYGFPSGPITTPFGSGWPSGPNALGAACCSPGLSSVGLRGCAPLAASANILSMLVGIHGHGGARYEAQEAVKQGRSVGRSAMTNRGCVVYPPT